MAVAVAGKLTGFSPKPVSQALVGALMLSSRGQTTRVEEALTAGRYETTIDGASTMILDVLDPDRELITSRVATEQTSLTFQGRVWVLVRVSRQDPTVTLTFEPAPVVALRGKRGARSVVAGKVTRINFMRSLCTEARVPVWVPAVDPVVQARSRAAATEKPERQKTPGFAAGAGKKVLVKGHLADLEQQRNTHLILTACWQATTKYPASVRRKALVMTMMAAIQESEVRNLPGGDRDSQGLFQQRPSSGYKHPRDPSLATRDFLLWAPGRDAALAVMLKRPDKSLGWCISEAQRDESYRSDGRAPMGQSYNKWRSQATSNVGLWLGDVKLTDKTAGSLTEKLAYEREDDESSWDALQRLAGDVQLRCFEQAGRIVISDDASLMALAGDVVVTPDEGWVLDNSFDFDVGMPAAESRVTGTLDATTVLHGRSVDVRGFGPADGRWLVLSVTQNLYADESELTLTRPQPVLPEQDTTSSSGSALATGASTGANTAETWARKQVGKPYIWGGGHGASFEYSLKGYDCSGFASAAAKLAGASITAPGSTMTLYPLAKNRPAPADAPVAWGFRGMSSGSPRSQHMGIRLNGRWYSAGGRGNKTIVTGDSNWDAVVIPPGL